MNGEVYAMAGGRPRHNALCANVLSELRASLRAKGSPCVVFTSDQRVRSEATDINTYPDVSVAGGPVFHRQYTDALTNPCLLVEVLSQSTQGYDRGAKLAHYQTMQSLSDYVLISQAEPRVEHYQRVEKGQSLLTVLVGEDAVLEVATLECSIPLREIYAQTASLPGDEPAA